MSLGPGHCACCCAGPALPVVPLLELCGAVWVIEHLAAVLIVCAVSGLLSTALAVEHGYAGTKARATAQRPTALQRVTLLRARRKAHAS